MAEDRTIEIPLGIMKREYESDPSSIREATLILETGKGYRGGLKADARVFWCGNGCRSHAFGLGGGGDFSKTIKEDRAIRPVTQKKIDVWHAEVFTPESIASITADAKRYYGAGCHEFSLTITDADGGNPEVSTITLDEIRENNDEVDDLLATLGQLAVGETYTDGGGAQPVFTYRRTK